MNDRVRLRPEIASIIPYRQGATAAEDAFKLSSNENPFPPLPEVMEALSLSSVNRYPEGSAEALRKRIAREVRPVGRAGAGRRRIRVGAGPAHPGGEWSR